MARRIRRKVRKKNMFSTIVAVIVVSGAVIFGYILLIFNIPLKNNLTTTSAPIEEGSKIGEEQSRVFLKRAIIIDSLAIDYPNMRAIEKLEAYLREAGFSEISYIGGRNATVDAFKRVFQNASFSLIIIRSHGGHIATPGIPGVAKSAIFTSEIYSEDKYIGLRAAGLLGMGVPILASNKTYFVVTSLFVESYGRFNNSIVIVYGCFSLSDPRLGLAFLRRGASIFIGWKGGVEITVIDSSLLKLIKELFIEKKPIIVSLRESSLSALGSLDALPRESYQYNIYDWLRLVHSTARH